MRTHLDKIFTKKYKTTVGEVYCDSYEKQYKIIFFKKAVVIKNVVLSVSG